MGNSKEVEEFMLKAMILIEKIESVRIVNNHIEALNKAEVRNDGFLFIALFSGFSLGILFSLLFYLINHHCNGGL